MSDYGLTWLQGRFTVEPDQMPDVNRKAFDREKAAMAKAFLRDMEKKGNTLVGWKPICAGPLETLYFDGEPHKTEGDRRDWLLTGLFLARKHRIEIPVQSWGNGGQELEARRKLAALMRKYSLTPVEGDKRLWQIPT